MILMIFFIISVILIVSIIYRICCKKKRDLNELNRSQTNCDLNPEIEDNYGKAVLSVITAENDNEFKTNIHSLLEKKLFSDVTLRCGYEEFKAHRSILSARSPVFLSKFKTTTQSGDVIDLISMDPSTARALLDYLYKGNINPILTIELAYALIPVSDIYELPGLKRACCSYLVQGINCSNALPIFKFANIHGLKAVKQRALEFMCSKYEELEKCPDWDVVKKDCPSLAIEIMNAKISSMKKFK